jgi:hypothetical protein
MPGGPSPSSATKTHQISDIRYLMGFQLTGFRFRDVNRTSVLVHWPFLVCLLGDTSFKKSWAFCSTSWKFGSASIVLRSPPSSS